MVSLGAVMDGEIGSFNQPRDEKTCLCFGLMTYIPQAFYFLFFTTPNVKVNNHRYVTPNSFQTQRLGLPQTLSTSQEFHQSDLVVKTENSITNVSQALEPVTMGKI